MLLGGVNYLTGELVDIPAVTAATHEIGAVAGWDLAHAVGNVPLELGAWGVDWAAWCHYKYVNAGPGGPAGAFVHARHAGDALAAAAGRLVGERSGDALPHGAGVRSAPGRGRLAGLDAPGARVRARCAPRSSSSTTAGIAALRARSLRLTGYLESLLDRVVAERRAHLITPREPQRRGCQLSLSVPDARTLSARLRGEHGVICDVREPDVIRLAPVPLYSSYDDCRRAAVALSELLPRAMTMAGRRRPSATARTPSRSPISGCRRATGRSPASCWCTAAAGARSTAATSRIASPPIWQRAGSPSGTSSTAASTAAATGPRRSRTSSAAVAALPAGVDRGRVALAGHSAGGHLALLAARRVGVRGVLAQAPMSDLRLGAELGACGGAVERLLAQGAPSPIDDPPDVEVLLVHGDADEHVPVELSRRYANGGHAVYVELVGCGHMEFLDPASDAGRLSGNWLERLLARVAVVTGAARRARAGARWRGSPRRRRASGFPDPRGTAATPRAARARSRAS